MGHQVHLVAALEQGTDQPVGQRLVVGAQAELVGRAFVAAMMQQRGDTQAHGELAWVALFALALEGQGEGDVNHLVAIGDVQLLEHIEGLVIAGEDHGALLHRPGRGLGAPIDLNGPMVCGDRISGTRPPSAMPLLTSSLIRRLAP